MRHCEYCDAANMEIERVTEIKDLAVKDSMAEAAENERLTATTDEQHLALKELAQDNDRYKARNKVLEDVLETTRHYHYVSGRRSDADKMYAAIAAATQQEPPERIQRLEGPFTCLKCKLEMDTIEQANNHTCADPEQPTD